MPDPRLRYRSVFVSDVHLGSVGCKVEEFQRFLNLVECENLYLVGDIVDLWVAMKASKWRQEHTDAVKTILDKSKEGTKIVYTPGNHDAFLRRLNGTEFGNIRFVHAWIHETADGKRLKVVHGDLFDRSVRFVPVAWLAAWAYEAITGFNGRINAERQKRGMDPVDFASVFKKRLKKYFSSKNDYEDVVLQNATGAGCHGVVCGHIHRPVIDHREDGVYVNTGDWVENCTAVVEHDDGRLELVWWHDLCPDSGTDPAGQSARPRLL